MYTLINEEADFDDALLCVASGFAVKNDVIAAPRVMVYPNPNRDGQLNFRVTGLDESVEHSCTIMLFDLQGQLVLQQSVKTGSALVDVSSLAQGLYQWSMTFDGVRLEQGSVTIF